MADGPTARPASSALVAEVRGLLQEALGHYGDASAARRVQGLLSSLDQPLRVGVLGPRGAGTSTLVEAMVLRTSRTGAPAPASASRDASDLHGMPLGSAAVADVYVVLFRDRGPEGIEGPAAMRAETDPFLRVRTIGVLTRADEIGDGDPGADLRGTTPGLLDAVDRCSSAVAQICHVVVPVSGLLALAAVTLDDSRHRAVARYAAGGSGPDDLLGYLGGPGLRVAAGLLRTGQASSREALAGELLRRSGLPRLEDLVHTRFLVRSAPLKAWSALRQLDTVVRAEPPQEGTTSLLRRIEQIQSGAHELTEMDAIDGLRSGEYNLGASDIENAVRLLGESGPDARTRLGLEAGAAQDAVSAAAVHALTLWRSRASHPAATPAMGILATTVVKSCEHILHAG